MVLFQACLIMCKLGRLPNRNDGLVFLYLQAFRNIFLKDIAFTQLAVQTIPPES